MSKRWYVALTLLTAVVGTACSSGPSSPDLRPPTTTTTTEPPPQGIAFVEISNGRFRPSNLKIDLDETPVVRWLHQDEPDREYLIEARNGEFSSPALAAGDVFEFDFSALEPGIYRYAAFVGNARIPGSVDTRPEQ